MTMLSFRVGDDVAQLAQEWADRLGVDRSELIRDALRRHLNQLRASRDLEAYERLPLRPDEVAVAEIAAWGPAEDWSDWLEAPDADAAG